MTFFKGSKKKSQTDTDFPQAKPLPKTDSQKTSVSGHTVQARPARIRLRTNPFSDIWTIQLLLCFICRTAAVRSPISTYFL